MSAFLARVIAPNKQFFNVGSLWWEPDAPNSYTMKMFSLVLRVYEIFDCCKQRP